MKIKKSDVYVLGLVLAGFAAGHLWGNSKLNHEKPAGTAGSMISSEGTLVVPEHSVPLSSYISEKSKQLFIKRQNDLSRVVADKGNHSLSASMDKHFFAPRLNEAKKIYPVDIKMSTMGGVRVDTILPKEGVAGHNKQRVLLNLHGGGFRVGEGIGGLVESIPIASIAKIKVISVHYRQGPEHEFPAASEDVASVYRALLKSYKAQSIGIFGCSAGAMLTAMTTAWLQKENLPRPGAIGLFCAGADSVVGGDSRYFGRVLQGYPPPPAFPNPTPTGMPYLPKGDELYSSLVSPVFFPQVLAGFPPTLVISGIRDGALSSVVYTHSQLVKAGVDADLHIWEGMWHGFINDIDLPEAKEALEVIRRFFFRHLK
jgi:epsilon-lactone hydrolase